MLRRLWVLVFVLTIFLFSAPLIQAQTEVVVNQFYGEGCPHCAKEEIFLLELEQKYPELKVKRFEIYYNLDNYQLLGQVANYLGVQVGGVPFLVIGEEYFIGFSSEIGKTIETQIQKCIQEGCEDVLVSLDKVEDQIEEPTPTNIPEKTQENLETTQLDSVVLPILGEQQLSKLSLPLLTVVLAFLDGFNPCAMWTLMFLISLLLGMNDRKRMWILGTTFIFVSGLVYFLFLSAWLNLFLIIGYLVWVRALIGVVAIFAGYLYLKDFWVNKDGACQISGGEQKQKVFTKLKEITQKQQLWLALSGIALLAIAVNMVELICSAGLPAIFTQVLSLSDLPIWQYYLYLVVYVIIFMLDDLFVFFMAMFTLKSIGVDGKYSRYSHLIGGILMLIIGVLLLVKPEWLMFG
jgi:thiol-disulfide isomerase/thioredoxin